VLSVWKSSPSPGGFPPIATEKVVLGRYDDQDSELVTEAFFLPNCQWIDVIVKCKNIPVYFSENEPGAVHFGVTFRLSAHETFSPDSEDVGAYPGGMANPFVGKMLYPRPFYQETRTGSDTVYVTAVRLFAEGTREGGNWLGSECILSFANYNIDKEAEVSYEIYKLAITQEWGLEYSNNVLIPWMTQRLGGVYNESETELLYEEWFEQFK